MSTFTGLAMRQNSRARRISCQRCADSNSVFDGMQPRRMHRPPISRSASITAAVAPRQTAVRAAA